jgi:hypothetical protein
MSNLLETARIRVADGESRSLLALETVIGFDAGPNGRFLVVAGERAYYLGTACDTCPLLFERLPGANRKVSPTAVSDRLRAGLQRLDADVLDGLRPAMPAGEYQVSLLQVAPQLVVPGGPGDYFAVDQLTVWGFDPFWGLPHTPRTEYYRSLTRQLTETELAFEFVVPMVPHGWLDPGTVDEYSERLKAGDEPTALALSVLEVREPAMESRDPVIRRHWCLVHYLLDGHHKVYAASLSDRPVTLLSFLISGSATPEAVERMLAILAGRS